MCCKQLLPTSRVCSYLVQACFDDLFIDMALSQQLRLQQRNVAFLEIGDDRANDILTFVRHLCLDGCQAPLP